MSIGENGRVCIGANVHLREFDGELVLLDLAGGNYFGLDAIGARMWKHLAEGASPAEVASQLVNEYDIDQPRLLADIITLADELLVRGLVVVRTKTVETAP